VRKAARPICYGPTRRSDWTAGSPVDCRSWASVRTTPPCFRTVVKRDCQLSSILCAFLLHEQWYKNKLPKALVYLRTIIINVIWGPYSQRKPFLAMAYTSICATDESPAMSSNDSRVGKGLSYNVDAASRLPWVVCKDETRRRRESSGRCRRTLAVHHKPRRCLLLVVESWPLES
jgi:hypothetical protein